MNKKISILGFAALALLASCSSEDNCNGNDVSQTIGNSDVEIRLGSGNTGTRASVESDANGTFEAEGLGIFCLAKNHLDINPTEKAISWMPTATESQWSIWMDNVEADAVRNFEGTATDIIWTDGVTRMYPGGNWHSYRFYGYYPRQEVVNATATQRNVDFTIDGTQDIIWGKTNVSDDSLAFCAKYFRTPEFKDVVPSISFKHKLMRLTFSTVAGLDANGSAEPALLKGIESITVLNVPTKGNLIIADRTNPENDGVIKFDWENDLADFPLREVDDQPLGTDHWVLETETQVGGGILLPVPEDPDYRFFVRINQKSKNGETSSTEYPIELRNSLVYEEGKSYNIKLIVHGDKIVKVKGTLNAWVEDDTTIGDIEL